MSPAERIEQLEEQLTEARHLLRRWMTDETTDGLEVATARLTLTQAEREGLYNAIALCDRRKTEAASRALLKTAEALGLSKDALRELLTPEQWDEFNLQLLGESWLEDLKAAVGSGPVTFVPAPPTVLPTTPPVFTPVPGPPSSLTWSAGASGPPSFSTTTPAVPAAGPIQVKVTPEPTTDTVRVVVRDGGPVERSLTIERRLLSSGGMPIKDITAERLAQAVVQPQQEAIAATIKGAIDEAELDGLL